MGQDIKEGTFPKTKAVKQLLDKIKLLVEM